LVVAERLRGVIEKIEIPGVGHLAASIGVALFPLHASTRAGLVTAADNALYRAKRTGRNRVCIFDGGVAESTPELLPASPPASEPIEQRL
jgi:diguanylate cyclase (GGDEF)-like protein